MLSVETGQKKRRSVSAQRKRSASEESRGSVKMAVKVELLESEISSSDEQPVENRVSRVPKEASITRKKRSDSTGTKASRSRSLPKLETKRCEEAPKKDFADQVEEAKTENSERGRTVSKKKKAESEYKIDSVKPRRDRKETVSGKSDSTEQTLSLSQEPLLNANSEKKKRKSRERKPTKVKESSEITREKKISSRERVQSVSENSKKLETEIDPKANSKEGLELKSTAKDRKEFNSTTESLSIGAGHKNEREGEEKTEVVPLVIESNNDIKESNNTPVPIEAVAPAVGMRTKSSRRSNSVKRRSKKSQGNEDTTKEISDASKVNAEEDREKKSQRKNSCRAVGLCCRMLLAIMTFVFVLALLLAPPALFLLSRMDRAPKISQPVWTKPHGILSGVLSKLSGEGAQAYPTPSPPRNENKEASNPWWRNLPFLKLADTQARRQCSYGFDQRTGDCLTREQAIHLHKERQAMEELMQRKRMEEKLAEEEAARQRQTQSQQVSTADAQLVELGLLVKFQDNMVHLLSSWVSGKGETVANSNALPHSSREIPHQNQPREREKPGLFSRISSTLNKLSFSSVLEQTNQHESDPIPRQRMFPRDMGAVEQAVHRQRHADFLHRLDVDPSSKINKVQQMLAGEGQPFDPSAPWFYVD